MQTQETQTTSAIGAAILVLLFATTGLASATGAATQAEEQGLMELAESLEGTEGFLGLRMAPGTDGVVQALFAGPAPDGLAFQPPGPWELEVVEELPLERARQRIDGVVDLSEAITPMVLPAAATGIGPGSHLIITIPGEGTFGCTANYVWEEGSTLHLGAAGHCFLPASERATHGESPASANYDASSVTVRVCILGCTFGGQTGFIFTGFLLTLGDVAYARQTDTGGDVGNDFGIVEIPSQHHTYVRTQMPVWGGPTGEGSIGSFDPIVHYGAGVGVGETFATQARAGYSIFNTGSSRWAAEAVATFGDSGSAVNTAMLSVPDVLVGDKAGGVLTHLVVGFEIVAGTQVPKAKSMASSDAGINISVKI